MSPIDYKQSKSRVRKLSPEDAQALALLQTAAFPNATLSLLGEKLLKEIYRERLKVDRGLYLGLEVDKTIVGFVCGAQGGTERVVLKSILMRMWWKVLWRSFFHPWILPMALMRGPVEHPFPRAGKPIQDKASSLPMEALKRPVYLLRFIAIGHEKDRNKGYGRELMKAFETHAKLEGARSMALSVLKENTAARSLYIAHGMWRVSSEDKSQAVVWYGKNFD